MALDILPDDLIVVILGSLDVCAIVSLRRVSKGFDRATRLRPLWVHLVFREVRGRRLSWPSYALPLTDVPTKTIEEYVVRATKADRQCAKGSELHVRKFSRCIVRAPNSIGWLRVVKGRWLIMELRGEQLEVWDLQQDQGSEPVASYRGLKRDIDGSCVDASAASSVTIILSTSTQRSSVIYFFSINLSHLGDFGPTPNFVLLDTFEGYSGLLDARARLAVFSCSASKRMPLVRDMRTGSIVYLRSFEATQRPQRLLSAHILKEYIFLMGPWTMEVYPITKIRSLMQGDPEDISPPVTHASQSLVYPGGEMANHVTVLDHHPDLSEPSSWNGESGFCLGVYVKRSTYWMLLHVRLDAGSDSSTFIYSIHPLFSTTGLRTIACCWGGSGQRLLLAVSHRGSIQVLCGGTPIESKYLYPDFEEGLAFEWHAIPDGEKDLFAGFAFDEASGFCVVATSSSRIWIDDFSSPSSSACKHPKENLHSMKIPLHPDPLWPLLHPLPWPAHDFPDNLLLALQASAPMSWSTEVDYNFPKMNDPECYGGARWFVNEALHVPGPASLVMFTVSALRLGEASTRIIQVSSGRLVAVETDLNSWSYNVKLLPSDIRLNQIPDLLRHLVSVRRAAGVDLNVDLTVVRRYMFWRSKVEDDQFLSLGLW
ncbi:hypothetical protein FRC01_007410 [Tulasnella sp. 417]|nr:hypothetical protein FRC01_007410 [Tulasnella sp. 417]